MVTVAGIDCGAQTTKVVVWSTNGQGFQFGPVLQNKGGAVESAAAKALAEVVGASDALSEVKFIVATGSMAPKLQIAHSRAPESLCLAQAADVFSPTVHTVIDAGAAKVLVVKCRGGTPLAVAHNDRCAGGTGVYLEMAAEVLGVPMAEFGALALSGSDTVAVQSTCAVFAESEIISLIHSGKKREDIARGVATSCANRIYPLLGSVAWEKDVAIVGGVAKNVAIAKALGVLTGSPLIVQAHAEFYAALGATFIAMEKVKD